MLEEKPDAENAGDEDRRREPAVIEKPIERAAVEARESAGRSARRNAPSRSCDVRAALGQNARAHQRREGERDQTGGENRDDDRDRELAENSAEQSRHESERNKDRRERERHRENGEGDFARAVQRRA